MANEVKTLTVNIGAFTGATAVPLFYLPSGYGGITVIGAKLFGSGAGTSVTGQLITMSDLGTPAANGTVAAFTTPGITAAGVVISSTVSSARVADGRWLGYSQASGTCPTSTWLNVYYVDGR